MQYKCASYLCIEITIENIVFKIIKIDLIHTWEDMDTDVNSGLLEIITSLNPLHE